MILLTQPRVGRSANEIIALQMAAESLGWEVLPTPYGWRLEEDLTKQRKQGLPYGAWTFCQVIADQMNWVLRRNTFDWLAKLPIEFTKRKVEFMTLGEAKKIQELKFIKPADDKCFDAKVYEPGTFKPAAVIEDNYPTLVSEPVEFTLEYRCFTDGNEVKTWSNYIYNEHLANPLYWDKIPDYTKEAPYDFVNKLLKEVPGITVPSVVDVGWIPNKGWAIIETNEAYASGLYGCDPVEALLVMSKAVQMERTMTVYTRENNINSLIEVEKFCIGSRSWSYTNNKQPGKPITAALADGWKHLSQPKKEKDYWVWWFTRLD